MYKNVTPPMSHIELLLERRKVIRIERNKAKVAFDLNKLQHPEEFGGKFDASEFDRKIANITNLISYYRRQNAEHPN
jgi:hypothetical protein